ncbi:MAG: nitroreductase family protein [Rikenellaceae bacterium]|nr:nitroreductase family protein [Rikenellaceae bacterium]
MKNIEEILLKRTSVRRYERQPIEEEKLSFIFEAIRNTPTSYNGQQFSVVAVTDQSVKEQLYEIMGQKQVKTCAAFLVFCLDFHQLDLAAKSKSIDFPDFQNSVNGYTVGVVDAALAMHSAEIAAESLGLGCCCIGYARTADPQKTAEILGLPEKVGIVCGLAIGYPRETPDLKPKRPVDIVVHKNRYTDDHTIVRELNEYDESIKKYNQERCGDKTCNAGGGHILDYHRPEQNKHIEDYLKNNSIDIKIK